MSDAGLTESERLLIENSFVRIISLSNQFTHRFYKLLFNRYPEVREMFPTDMDAQKDKFVLMLATLVEYLDDPDKFHAEVAELGSRHAGYGTEVPHYQAVGECFMATLRQGSEFGEDEIAAWVRLYEIVEKGMMAG